MKVLVFAAKSIFLIPSMLLHKNLISVHCSSKILLRTSVIEIVENNIGEHKKKEQRSCKRRSKLLFFQFLCFLLLTDKSLLVSQWCSMFVSKAKMKNVWVAKNNCRKTIGRLFVCLKCFFFIS